MEKLVDILRNASRREDLARLGTLDTSIFQDLAVISRSVYSDHNQNRVPDAIPSYQKALEDFATGLEGGYANKSKPILENKYLDHGRYVGSSARAEIDAARDDKDVQTSSCKRLVEQWRSVIPILQGELRLLMQAQQAPYHFLLSYIRTNNDGFAEIAEGLNTLFTQHEDLVQLLLYGELRDDFVRDLERKSESRPQDCAQLGIVYLFRSEISRARHSFTQAEPFYANLEHVAGSILKAHTIFMQAYSRTMLARQFGLEMVKV